MAKGNVPQSAVKSRSTGTQAKPLGAVLSLMNHQDTDRNGAMPRLSVSVRKDMQSAHDILLIVAGQATLLASALDNAEQDEPTSDDCVHGGGAENAAKAIKAGVRQAQTLLDNSALCGEAAAICHELLDVWSLAAVAVHALACDAPLCGRDGESMVSRYPAAAAIRSIRASADGLCNRLDRLMQNGPPKLAA